MSVDFKTIDELLQKCNKEIATIEDIEKRNLERDRIKELMAKYKGDDEVITSFDYIRLHELEKKKNPLRAYSKIPGIDKIIDGFREGNLITVSGATKMGKTLYCQTLTENFLKQDIRSLWFSYEVPMSEFLERYTNIPFFCLPKQMTGNTMDWVEKRIIEGIGKYDIKSVFIDHLHYLFDLGSLGKGINSSLAIGAIMRELKKMAIRHEVIIFLVAHIGKTMTHSSPDIDSIRDSSFVAQESDIVIMVSRYRDKNNPKVFKDESEISVVAHRRTGKTGSVDVMFQDNQFKEIDKIYGESLQ